jgi:protoheme IX farnesyltransferase
MTDLHISSASRAEALGGQGTAGDYLALLKPRVMSLVIFTAVIGLLVAPGQIHPVLAIVAIIAIAMGAGASGALNMWYDADIDAVMKRTATRPVPRGAILPGEALGFGLVLSFASVLMLGLLVNPVAGLLLAFTIFFYAVIYTMWLKRSTPQNIVIGGAAGALPPVIAWASVTGTVDIGALTLFLIIFMWTPPHFWALALFRETDYGKAGIPMLPNVAGREVTRRHILAYSALLLPTVALPYATSVAGPVYLVAALALTLEFLRHAWRVYRRGDEDATHSASKKLFGYSILWLFLIFALIPADRLAMALLAQG